MELDRRTGAMPSKLAPAVDGWLMANIAAASLRAICVAWMQFLGNQ